MAIDTETLLLTIVGLGVIITGVVLIMTLQQPPPVKKPSEVIPVGWAGGWIPTWGPYYSHLPVRPLVY